MQEPNNHLSVPVNRPLQLNLNELTYTDPPQRSPMYLEHSPGLSQKIKIPKKKYSYADPLERMDTPVFDKLLSSLSGLVSWGTARPLAFPTMPGDLVTERDELLGALVSSNSSSTLSHIKKGPSSAATVLTMAGMFVVGILLMMSGTIVLIVHTETPFIITGCLFMGVGFAMLLVCGILQRKNVVKFVLDMNRDLYFLNINKTMMWKSVFDSSELPLAG